MLSAIRRTYDRAYRRAPVPGHNVGADRSVSTIRAPDIGLESEPHYLLALDEGKRATARIAAWWRVPTLCASLRLDLRRAAEPVCRPRRGVGRDTRPGQPEDRR